MGLFKRKPKGPTVREMQADRRRQDEIRREIEEETRRRSAAPPDRALHRASFSMSPAGEGHNSDLPGYSVDYGPGNHVPSPSQRLKPTRSKPVADKTPFHERNHNSDIPTYSVDYR